MDSNKPVQIWYSLFDAAPLLGHRDAEALRRWVRKNRANGRLKLKKHIKPLDPNAKRVIWRINVAACQDL
jgi:hypothetical protein